MRNVLLFLSLILISTHAYSDSAVEPPALSNYVQDKTPWRSLKANSEQRQPVYMGLSPFDIERGAPKRPYPVLRESLRALGELQARYIASFLHKKDIDMEIWPVQEWQGRQTWAFARWRPAGGSAWTWFDDGLLRRPLPADQPQPELPRTLDPQISDQDRTIFADFMSLDDLYAKPSFGECIWTRKKDASIVHAWNDPDQVSQARHSRSEYQTLLCRAISQPARFNEIPQTFVLRLRNAQVMWPAQLRWQSDAADSRAAALPMEKPSEPALLWPADWRAAYAAEIRILSGQSAAEYTTEGRSVRVLFERKNSADRKNQLLDLVSYLEFKYRQAGIGTERESFIWRGIPQANLLAKIPGKNRALPPIVMADHIDTAFCEDVFARSGNKDRVSAPGADDNAAATAALLQAAYRLSGAGSERDIWLYHLTGEEFPGDDLGARIATSGWLRNKQELGGIVLLDMIGYRKRNDRIFQINAGKSADSLKISQLAYLISLKHQGPFQAILRPPFDPRSYLYNTDGQIFSDAGYPVVLFNEHINRLENLSRPHYHQSTDTEKTLDLDYAAAVVQSAIATVAYLAAR